MVAPAPAPKIRFRLGQLVATPGALAALERSGQGPMQFVSRHASGDWGDVGAEDWKLNDQAVVHEGDPDRQGRILSSYKTSLKERLWIITEFDRSVSTILTPDEY